MRLVSSGHLGGAGEPIKMRSQRADATGQVKGGTVVAEPAKRAAPPSAAEPPRLAALAERLKLVEKAPGWTRSLRIGRLIIGELFANDPARWHSQPRLRTRSIQQLARLTGKSLGRAVLTEAVNVYLLWCELPQVRTLVAVRPAHAAAVLGLPAAAQLELLQWASEEGLDLQTLRAKCTSLRKLSGERRGRPSASSGEKALTRAKRAVRALAEASALLLGEETLEDRTAARIGVEVRRAVDLLCKLQTQMHRHEPDRKSEPVPVPRSETALLAVPARETSGAFSRRFPGPPPGQFAQQS